MTDTMQMDIPLEVSNEFWAALDKAVELADRYLPKDESIEDVLKDSIDVCIEAQRCYEHYKKEADLWW